MPAAPENGERSAPAGRRVGRRENGRASKLGQTQRCAAITKNTKNHKDTQSTTQFRAQRHTEGYTEEHRDGLPVYFGNHKGHEGPPCRREATNLPRLRGTKGIARRRGRAVRARKAHVRPGGLRGMAGFARHALGEGALTRPGEQRTENGEQRARGKRATVKPLYVSGVGHRPVVLQPSLVRRFRRFRRFRSAPVGRRVETARREADGREGAISGRLARSVIGVSPSDFARTRVFAGKRPAGFPRTGLLRCRRA